MKYPFVVVGLATAIASCTTVQQTAFDPGADDRIGAEVRRACNTGRSSGGHREISGWDTFIYGSRGRQYLLVFSNGCRGIGDGDEFPVFENFGGDCRHVGELIRTATVDFGVTGACSIQHIYEWDRKEDSDDAPMTD